MLFDENACRQRLDGVAVEHRHGGLQHDRPVVELGVHDVHRRAGHTDAMLERLTLRVEAGKRGQQRRMDVEDAVRKRAKKRIADETHEAGEADELDASPLQKVRQRAVVGVAVGIIARGEVKRLDSGVAGALQTGRLSAIGDDDRNPRVEPPGSDRVDDRLKVAAAPGDQYAD